MFEIVTHEKFIKVVETATETTIARANLMSTGEWTVKAGRLNGGMIGMTESKMREEMATFIETLNPGCTRHEILELLSL